MQLAYSINMAQYGIPGLKFNAYHARGFDIDGTKYSGTAYDVKNMNGEDHSGIQHWHVICYSKRTTESYGDSCDLHHAPRQLFQADGNINEFRLVTTIPFNIL